MMQKKGFIQSKLAKGLLLPLVSLLAISQTACNNSQTTETVKQDKASEQDVRERIRLKNWKFFKYPDDQVPDTLIYDVRPVVKVFKDDKDADTMPTAALDVEHSKEILKPWILPTANDFILDADDHYLAPASQPQVSSPITQIDFDDADWQRVTVPHDWAIAGPFLTGHESKVGGGMGRLPSPGVAWYRKEIQLSASDSHKSIFLDVDGAMSYAMVWINGKLAGGWPYGYASWRVDLTPYIKPADKNIIAIKVDNPYDSSRWYPGGGLYRNVWLTKVDKLHIAQWGTHVQTTNVSAESADVSLTVTLENDDLTPVDVLVETKVYSLNSEGQVSAQAVASFAPQKIKVAAQTKQSISSNIVLQNPKLWGPKPQQTPNLYLAMTQVTRDGKLVENYPTQFGIRSLKFDADQGVFVNGQHIYLQGVNQHHDLGALGAAFNVRAAERQLEILREMGVNAIRLAHNPPDTQLLDLTDRMGFLVVNEIFDVWERKKTPHDSHLIFPEWHEADLRSFMRRDRNNPSVIMWSVGNEVGEQYTGQKGAKIARRLQDIAKEEDSSRPTSSAMNYAQPPMPLPGIPDTVSLNYQGEGIRNAPAYAHLKGINTPPVYPKFHEAYPDKMIFSSENAAAVSSRGEYLYPVTPEISAPVANGSGGNPDTQHVSAYELYTTPFGSSADKVLSSLAKHPYVAGGFIWSGWDYLGEPTPYYSSRSSYFGVIDLAGFKKDRFYLYQSHWRPDLPAAHILPHWNWPERIGKVTPVHVFTSGDEAELFVNGVSQGKKMKGQYELRLRWDEVVYQPGKVEVVAYKNGKEWARNEVTTTGAAQAMQLKADRKLITADGEDLSFISVKLVDKDSKFVATAKHKVKFTVTGPAQIVATDNGDPTDMTPFSSHTRNAFNGLALVIVQGQEQRAGKVTVKAEVEGMQPVAVELLTQLP